jgi:cytochrome c oxidase subunit 3
VAPDTALHAHQFDSLEQQHEAASLGMWIFLVTEVMFFGGMFLMYAAYRAAYPAAFVAASLELDLVLGGINTAVLLTSSLTMALAVNAAATSRDRGKIVKFLVVTALLGVLFLGFKGIEYHHKWEQGLVPGWHYTYDGPQARHAQLMFSLYFAMTGFHALHIIIGLGLIAVMALFAWQGRFSPEHHTGVEVTGLYWHFVDIVWVFLYPLLYLIR